MKSKRKRRALKVDETSEDVKVELAKSGKIAMALKKVYFCK